MNKVYLLDVLAARRHCYRVKKSTKWTGITAHKSREPSPYNISNIIPPVNTAFCIKCSFLVPKFGSGLWGRAVQLNRVGIRLLANFVTPVLGSSTAKYG